MTDGPEPQADEVIEAYRRAAEVGGRAPSVHNTQPWRWLATRTGLELRADRSRQLRVADPEGRLLTISCGAALHHALLALHAAGWVPQVVRMPDARSADALAQITVSGRQAATAQQRRLFDEIDVRHTDRRPTIGHKVPHDALELIRQAAVNHGAGLHRLAGPDLDDLAVAAARANEIGLNDADQRTEMDYWVGGTRPTRTGVPSDAVPQSPPQTDVPGRDFGRPGTLEPGHGHAHSAVYGLLFTPVTSPVTGCGRGGAVGLLAEGNRPRGGGAAAELRGRGARDAPDPAPDACRSRPPDAGLAVRAGRPRPGAGARHAAAARRADHVAGPDPAAVAVQVINRLPRITE
ncbi:nitroreductase [Catellatospora coxensis]